MRSKPIKTKSIINYMFKELKKWFRFIAKSLPKNWRLVFRHLEIQRTAYNIHFDRNVHRINTFNLKEKSAKLCHARLSVALHKP